MIKTELRPNQAEARDRAVASLRGGGGFLLLPEPRVGKTLVALSVVDTLKPYWLIVVCPKGAISEWEEQIKTHLKLTWKMRITLINYEQVVAHRKFWYNAVRKALKGGAYPMIIADEAHRIKTRGASRSRVVRHLARYAVYRLALTGTPIAQGIHDAWALFDFADPDIFGPYDDQFDKKTKELIQEGFDSTYVVWGGFKKHEIVRYRNIDQFNEIFHKHSYRITLREAKKEGGKSLKLNYREVPVALEAKALQATEELTEELVTVVNEKKIKLKHVLALVTKLQQITGGAILDEDHTPQITGHEKIEALHTIVRSLRARSKFIVIARFIHELERIQGFLRRLGYSVALVRGGIPYDRKFETDAICMQIQSAQSVDMSQANLVIFYSLDYSFLNYEQSRFRILSYDKEVGRYVFLLANDSVDVLIFTSVTRKQNLAKLVCDTYRNNKGTRDGKTRE